MMPMPISPVAANAADPPRARTAADSKILFITLIFYIIYAYARLSNLICEIKEAGMIPITYTFIKRFNNADSSHNPSKREKTHKFHSAVPPLQNKPPGVRMA